MGWVAAAAVLLLAIAAVLSPRDPPAPAPLSSVAVLPVDARGDSTLADIAEALAEGVITGLVRLEGLKVPAISRTSAQRDRDPRVAGRELGVQAVLVSSVRRIGSTMRLTPQLISVADGLVLWSGNYDGQIGDVFAMVDSLTLKIVDGLRLRLTDANRAVLARGIRTRDTVAYKLYLEARRANTQLTKASTARARVLLEQAIARDSMYADAWAALVPTLDFVARFSTEPPEHFNAAMRRAANRAVELDSLSGFALVQRGWIRALQDWDWDGAQRDMRRAIKLSPGSFDPLHDYAFLLSWLNQADSMLVFARRAFDSSAAGWNLLGWAFNAAGKVDSALIAFERIVAIDSNFSDAYGELSHAYLDAGRRADADRANARYLDFSGDDAQGIGWAAVYYRRAGDLAGAREMLRRLKAVERGGRSWGMHSATSMVRLALGDQAGALQSLEAATQAREYLLPATVAYALGPLRGEPRWRAIHRRVFGDRAPQKNFYP
jgi:TolB-like protein